VVVSCGLSADVEMVEAAGIEPASARPLPLALHAYPRL